MVVVASFGLGPVPGPKIAAQNMTPWKNVENMQVGILVLPTRCMFFRYKQEVAGSQVEPWSAVRVWSPTSDKQILDR